MESERALQGLSCRPNLLPEFIDVCLKLEALFDSTGSTPSSTAMVELAIPEDDTPPYAPILLPLQCPFQAVEADSALHADGLCLSQFVRPLREEQVVPPG
jgi:hypothetical protein